MDSLVTQAKNVYRMLPTGGRSAAASAYGWYLRWWRYGSATGRLVESALERDHYTPAQWVSYQDERLSLLLERAATVVPYYREYWRARRAAGDATGWDDLHNWPVLDKAAVRQNPRAFVADDVDTRSLFRVTTSGTSGSPITTWRSRHTMQAWYALFEARTRRWYGVDQHTPWAILGGQLVVPAEQQKPPYWVWNSGLRQLYMSTLHISEGNVGSYLEAMRKYGVEYMYGYASSMYWLAKMASAQNVKAPRMRVAVSNAEPLTPQQRELIGSVFGCAVRNTYGMAEIVVAAGECEQGEMHYWPDAGVVEVLADNEDVEVPHAMSGRIIGTGLLNLDMPLIRYDTGDRGALESHCQQTSTCGRSLPLLDRVEGRTTDNLVTADGRRVFWINPVFYDLPLCEAQVVQRDLESVDVNVVPDRGFNDEVPNVIRDRLVQRLGAIDVRVHCIESIPRGANGKFRAVVSLVAESSPECTTPPECTR